MRICTTRAALKQSVKKRHSPAKKLREYALFLQHRQAARFWPARKRRIERGNFILAERELARAGILRRVFRIAGFWNREYRGFTDEETQRDLTRRGLVRVSDFLQELPAGARGRRKVIVAERRIGDDGDTMARAPRNHGVFDRALLQMIEHLVAGDLAFAGHGENFVEVVSI